MEMLGQYELTGKLTSQNSGYSVWGFGKQGGKNFFLKQFLSPKYPEHDTVSSPERLERKRKECAEFERKKLAVYQVVDRYSDGNAVRVREFFRINSKYYISMRKIEALNWDVQTIAAMRDVQKRRLCAIIAHSIAGLHDGGLIHADLKHDNILFMHTDLGTVTAKVIDFDSSFLESDPPPSGEEIVGDLVYFSPEACLSIWGEEVKLTCRMDVFALGVLFHQYLTGELPGFDREHFGYPGEAAANGADVWVSDALEPELAELLQQMLQTDPQLRPTAWQVYEVLSDKPKLPDPEPARDETPVYNTIAPTTVRENPFFRPGDL